MYKIIQDQQDCFRVKYKKCGFWWYLQEDLGENCYNFITYKTYEEAKKAIDELIIKKKTPKFVRVETFYDASGKLIGSR
jgi:hypothetical protein